MLQVVVVLNVLISLLCLYVAWRLWMLRRSLAVAVNVLTNFERTTYTVLHGAPKAIYQGQLGVSGLRARYQQLEQQWQKVQQVLALLGLLQSVWRIALSTNVRSPSRRLQRPQRSRRRSSFRTRKSYDV